MHDTSYRSGLRLFTALCAALLGVACAGNPPPEQILPPNVFLTDVAPVGAGLFEQRIRLDFRVSNPNTFALDTYGLSFTLDMNGEPLAQGVSSEALRLPALGEQIISVEASTTTFGLLHQLLRLSERRELSYQLDGRFLLGEGVGAPFVAFERAARLGPRLSEPAPTLPGP